MMHSYWLVEFAISKVIGVLILVLMDDTLVHNEEQDVKKSIMMIVGACIFLVAAAQALPLFFGL